MRAPFRWRLPCSPGCPPPCTPHSVAHTLETPVCALIDAIRYLMHQTLPFLTHCKLALLCQS